VICTSGRSLDVVAETPTIWVTAARDAPLPGYVCVVAKQHVVEQFELTAVQQATFWHDTMVVARPVADLVHPVKMNYEIHGNTLPHLHLNLFPRSIDDPYVGGPIDPRVATFRRSDAELSALQVVVSRSLVDARTDQT
jgi:diadenosine tetraphosphate (Ap4A) HIT family hydrolase